MLWESSLSTILEGLQGVCRGRTRDLAEGLGRISSMGMGTARPELQLKALGRQADQS